MNICIALDDIPVFLAQPLAKKTRKTNSDRVEWLYGVSRANLKRMATPKWSDRKRMLVFYREARKYTKLTGVKHEVDHIVPLRNKNVCGLHVPENLAVIKMVDNRKKRNAHYFS